MNAKGLLNYFKSIRELNLDNLKSYIEINASYVDFCANHAALSGQHFIDFQGAFAECEARGGIFVEMDTQDETIIKTIEVNDCFLIPRSKAEYNIDYYCY